jgi:hypothetical protein
MAPARTNDKGKHMNAEQQETEGAIPVYNATNGNNNWATPRTFLNAFLAELDLPPVGLDIAAAQATTLAPLYFAPDHPDRSRRDALKRRASWQMDRDPAAPAPRVTRYLNPPYGRLCTICKDKVWKGKPSGLPKEEWCERRGHTSSTVLDWVRRADDEGRRGLDPLVMLVPARTDTEWWHRHVHGVAARVFFVEGRLRFLDSNLQPAGQGPAPFPSAMIEYVPHQLGGRWITQFGTITNEGRVVRAAERRLACGTCGGESCHS